MRAAGAAYHRVVALKHAPAEIKRRAAVFVLAGHAVVLDKSFKAGHHLVGFRYGILAGVEPVLGGEPEYRRFSVLADVNDIRRVVKIFLLSGKVVEADERLQNRH